MGASDEDCDAALNEDRTTAAYDLVFCFLAGLAPTELRQWGCGAMVSMLAVDIEEAMGFI